MATHSLLEVAASLSVVPLLVIDCSVPLVDSYTCMIKGKQGIERKQNKQTRQLVSLPSPGM
jgi:hypothetical protein